MRVLIDTDIFCKLAITDLLADAVALFDAELGECGRLPALPHMLRRGRLRRTYGSAACERLIPLAQTMPRVEHEARSWLGRIAPVPEIDPGEAILFAAAAERTLPVLTGDVRSLRELGKVLGLPKALAGRVVVLEAILLALCQTLGTDAVRARLTAGSPPADTVMRICFSPDVVHPEVALMSYLRDRTAKLAPLILWGHQGV